MSADTTVAIVGSGPAATAVAHYCAQRGIDVTIFEKGPTTFQHPFVEAFQREGLALLPTISTPSGDLMPTVPQDVQSLDQHSSYKHDLNQERRMIVGGNGTIWGGFTPRMFPSDFQTKSRFGYGTDWPITYDELEPFVCKAEWFLGVSGTEKDNPFAPHRSKPFPLPPFELGYYDQILADRAKAHGIVIHTTEQARNRQPHDGRAGCQNFGVCYMCPTGAMYAPNHHLQQAVATGKCTIQAETSVRRILVENGRVRGVVVQQNNAAKEVEVPAKYVVVAGGVIESVRLMLLSNQGSRSDGLGNAGGHLGRHLILKHIWRAHLHFKKKMFPDRIVATSQSHQFIDAPTRGKHGAIKVNLSSNLHDPSFTVAPPPLEGGVVGQDKPRLDSYIAPSRVMANCRRLALLGESVPNDNSFISLSERKDRFGDPFASVQMEDSAFDHATYDFATTLVDKFAAALGVADVQPAPFEGWSTGHHHYGGCRAGTSARDSVVDSYGEVHGTSNLFLVGSATFPSQSSNNPTLTIVALAIRMAEKLAERAGAKTR